MQNKFFYPIFVSVLTLVSTMYSYADKALKVAFVAQTHPLWKLLLFMLFVVIGVALSVDGLLARRCGLEPKQLLNLQLAVAAANMVLAIIFYFTAKSIQVFNIILAVYFFAVVLQRVRATGKISG